jgi:hypothetical protein
MMTKMKSTVLYKLLVLAAIQVVLVSSRVAKPGQRNSTSPVVEYQPGNLVVLLEDQWLSKGMTIRKIATAGEPVPYANGQVSAKPFHAEPDGAAVFKIETGNHTGGWLYVSNSEVEAGGGGVGAIVFDKDGNVVEYKTLLEGTTRNCNGGMQRKSFFSLFLYALSLSSIQESKPSKIVSLSHALLTYYAGKTKWNSWISCEEDEDLKGKCWQVDPFGVRDPVPITLGSGGGSWESFAHDTRDPNTLYAFITEDRALPFDGAVQRMTIENPDYSNAWDILLGTGKVDYLFIEPSKGNTGTYKWIDDEAAARQNAAEEYPQAEGLLMDGNTLWVVVKLLNGFYQLNLDTGTWVFERVPFDGYPDQTALAVQEDGSKLTYWTQEEGVVQGCLGRQAGLYTRNEAGEYTNILFGYDRSPGKLVFFVV